MQAGLGGEAMKRKRITDKQRVDWIVATATWANMRDGRHMALECIISRKAIDAAIKAK